MAKESYIKIRCTEEYKKMVENRASEYGKTITNYIENLIRKDMDTMRVVYEEFLNDEMCEDFEKLEGCYKSSDGTAFLFINMDEFYRMDKKYNFDIETDDRDRIYNTDILDYIRNRYDEIEYNLFGYVFAGCDYIEEVEQTCNDNIHYLENNEWDKIIDDWMKSCVMTTLSLYVETELKKMKDNGFDIIMLKNTVENC